MDRENSKAGRLDPRIFQIFFLGCLLGTGVFFRDFSVRTEQVAATFAAAIATQLLVNHLSGARGAGLRSALITSLGLSLLLRADGLWVHPLAAAIAIGGKLVFRFRGKHLFNPANLGVLAAILLLPGAWVSPGQWGDDLALAGWVVALGFVVTQSARRGDVSWAFLAFWLGLAAFRLFRLGQPFPVLLHQLSNGALLLFAFFMISDPMTIPNDRRARIVHAALVAAVAHIWQFELYRTNALLWALFLAVPFVPLLDALFPAAKFQWNSNQGGKSDEPRLFAASYAPPGASSRRLRVVRAA